MKNLLFPILLAGIMTQGGCAAVARFETPALANLPEGRTYSDHALGFLWGIVPPAPLSLERCGEPGIQKMKVKQGLIDLIITGATGGLIISYKVKTTCAEAPKG